MKKRTKRILAMLLASAMILQQGSTVGVLATETEPVSETVAETQSETTAQETQAPETTAETKAPETQATEAALGTTQTDVDAAQTEQSETVAATQTEQSETAAATETTETAVETTESTEQSETTTQETTEALTEAVTEKETEAVTETPKTNLMTMSQEPTEIEFGDDNGIMTIAGDGMSLKDVVKNGGSLSVSKYGDMWDEPMSRSGKLGLRVDFSLADSEVDSAIDNSPWVYDLSDFVDSSSSVLKNIEPKGRGKLFDNKNQETGEYEIKDNKIYIYPKEDLKGHTGVSGYVTFEANLDESKIHGQKEVEFSFDGYGELGKLTFEEIQADVSKSVENGASGDVFIEPQPDGSVKLHYKVQFKPTNADLTELTLTDEFSGNQTLDLGSFKIWCNWDGTTEEIPSDKITVTGNQFTIDVAELVREYYNSDVKKNSNYVIEYTTTISADSLKNLDARTNHAAWTWEGSGTKDGGSTSVIPHKKLTVTKTMTDGAEKDIDGETWWEYTYTITFGANGEDMAGHTISDQMSNNQKLEGEIVISPQIDGLQVSSDGKGSVLESEITYDGDYQYTHEYKDLFTYTFPEKGEGGYNGPYIGPYTVTYKTVTKKELPGVAYTGEHDVSNKATDEHDGDKGSDDESRKYDFGTKDDKLTLTKTFKEWDYENSLVKWTIDVTVGTEIVLPQDVVITDDNARYGATQYNWNVNPELEIVWDDVEVVAGGTTLGTTVIENGSYYTVDEATKSITIHGLNERHIVITMVTKAPGGFIKDGDSWAYNHAKVQIGEKSAEDDADEKFEVKAYEVTKTGSYDYKTGEFTWTVVLNPNKLKLDENLEAWFSDDIPEGHTFIGWGEDSERVSVTVAEQYQSHTGTVKVSLDANGDIPNTNVSTLDYGWNISETFYLSENSFTIQYKTVLTEDEKAEQEGQEPSYTNTAYWNDSKGAEFGRASVTIKREHTYVDKEDLTPLNPGKENPDIIIYKVNVNPEGLRLNDGNVLTLTDTLSDAVDLILDSIDILDKEGHDLKVSGKAQVRYSDHLLTIVVPDQTPVTVTFTVRALNLGRVSYPNKVTLSGSGIWDDTTNEEHNIQEHSGGLSGTVQGISLYKIDADDLDEELSGAEFELYQETVESDNKLGESREIAPTEGSAFVSDADGVVTFDKLIVDALYSWKEIKAPEGYQLPDDATKNYFILYNRVEVNGKENIEETAKNRESAQEKADAISAANGNIKIHVLPIGYSWTVSNKKVEKGNLKITKTFAGAELTGEEKEALGDRLTFNVYGPAKDENKGDPIIGGTFTYSEMTGGVKSFTGLEPGTYTVEETKAGVDGYTVTTTYTVDGEITETGSVTVGSGDAAITVTNTYVKNAETQFNVEKDYNDGTFEGKTFSFTLRPNQELTGTDVKIPMPKDEDGNEKESVTVTVRDGSTTSSFGSIEFAENNTYYYTIEEVRPEGVTAENKVSDGVVYDTSVYYVKVTVGDNADKTAKTVTVEYSTDGGATWEEEDGTAPLTVTFKNQKTAKLTVSKTITGLDEDADAKTKVEGTLTFKVYGPKDETTGLYPSNPLATISYKDLEVEGAVENLVPGTYKVVEENAVVSGYSCTTTYEVTVGTEKSNTEEFKLEQGQEATVAITNAYTDNGITFGGKKFIEGIDSTDKEFTIELYETDEDFEVAENAEPIKQKQTVGTKAGKPYTFDSITYEAAKESVGTNYHYYVVKEKVADEDGFTTDTTEYKITVTVVKDTDGALTVTSSVKDGADVTSLNFTNEYSEKGTAEFKVQKTYNGGNFEGKTFHFTLTPEDPANPMPKNAEGKVVNAVDVNGSAAVSFGSIEFTDIKDYVYIIQESAADPYEDVVYSTKEYKVKVSVAEGPATGTKKDGTRKVTVTSQYSTDGGSSWSKEETLEETSFTAEFVNVKKGMLQVTKTIGGDLAGKVLTPDQQKAIKFEVYGPKTGTDIGSSVGSFTYADMESGVWTSDLLVPGIYTVKETESTLNGYNVTTTWGGKDADDKTDGFQIEVVAGQISSPASVTVTNTYTQPDKAVLKVKKTVNGNPPEDQTFTFELYSVEAGAEPVDTVTVNGSGEASFEALKYEEAGVHVYKIKEHIPDPLPAGYTYDEGEYTVTVTVSEKSGILSTSVEYKKDGKRTDDVAEFINTYKPKQTTLTLHAKKNYKYASGAAIELKGEEFKFSAVEVTAPNENGTVKAGGYNSGETSNVAGGAVTFPAITYEEAGTHYYKITEVIPTLKDNTITYATNVYYVTVTVSDTNAQLSASADMATEAKPVEFTNIKADSDGKAELQVKKIYEGDTEFPAGGFTFTLTAIGNTLGSNVVTPMPDGATGASKQLPVTDGTVQSFGQITYTENGTYYYKISEVRDEVDKDGVKDGVLYDDTVYYVAVKVEGDGNGGRAIEVTYDTEDEKPYGESFKSGEPFVFEFTNTKVGEQTKIEALEIPVQKTVKPAGSAEGYKFKLEAVDGAPIPEGTVTEVTTDKEGNAKFELKYGIADYQADLGEGDTPTPFVYKVSEVRENPKTGITYDETVYTVTVTFEASDPVYNKDQNAYITTVTAKKAVTKNEEIYTAEALEFVNNTTVKVGKADENGQPLSGAKLKVTVKDAETETVVAEWTTDGTPKDLTGNLAAGKTYILEETETPRGYRIADPVTFSINGDGQVVADGEVMEDGLITMTDTKIKLEVNKKATGTGEELDGAVLELLDKDGKVLDSWTSKKGQTHDFGSKLKAGESYTLRETVAPDGYTCVTDMKFTVAEDGTVTGLDSIKTTDTSGNTVYVVEDTLNKVSIEKVDESGAALSGAKLVIKDAESAVVYSWTTDGKAHEITGLAKGKYTLSEVEAPEGYEVSKDVPFEITGNEMVGSVLSLKMTDTKTPDSNVYSLTVTKHLRLDGVPSELGAKDVTYYVALFSDAEKTQRVSNVKKIEFHNETSSTVTFDKLAEGTYYVGETDENGTLLVSKIVNNEIIFYPEYSDDGKVELEGRDTDKVADFTNVYMKLTNDFYLSGQITVTKKILVNGEEGTSDETYYARLFTDPELTDPLDEILALDLAGNSSASVTVTNLPIGETLDSTMSYYVAETDENGNVLDPDAVTEFEISIDKSEIVLSANNSAQEVVITNSFTEEETETETETEVPKKAAPKTGDDTDFMRYLLLMALSAGICAVAFEEKRRRNRARK